MGANVSANLIFHPVQTESTLNRFGRIPCFVCNDFDVTYQPYIAQF